MKRIAGAITIIALFTFLLAWDFTPRAAASKTARQKSATEAREARKDEMSKLFLEKASKEERETSSSEAESEGGRRLREEGENEECDPDMAPGTHGVIDREDYLRQRSDQINSLRGIEPDKPFDITKRVNAIHQMEYQEAAIAQLAKNSSRPEAALAAWTPIGPNFVPNGQTDTVQTPVTGRIAAIDIDPTNPNIVYVGTAQGGLWRTLDGGTTWTALMDTAQTLAIGAVTVDPLNPSILFVGTGEGNNSTDSYPGVGVYRINGANGATPVINGPFDVRVAGTGTAVTSPSAFLNTGINKIAVDPNNDNRIFVGNEIAFAGNPGGQVPTIARTGLYFSENALSAAPTFSKVSTINAANDHAPIQDIVFEPGSSDNLLVAEMDRFGSGGIGGVWRSTNASTASVAGNVAPTFTRTLALGVNLNVKLAIQKTGATVTVYAASGETHNPVVTPVTCDNVAGTVRKSVDGGATWSTPLVNADGFCYQQCFYDIALDVDPTNANAVHLGGWANASGCDHIYQGSTDGGANFTPTEQGLHADTHFLKVAPSNPSIVYFGSDGGVWKSINAGATWTSVNPNGISALQFQSLAVHPTSRNYTLGGTQDNGTPRRNDLGVWDRADLGDGGYALIDQTSTDTLANMRIYHTRFAQTNAHTYLRVTNGASAVDGGWESRGCGFTGAINNGFGVAGGVTCPTGAVGEVTCPCRPTTAILFYPPIALGPLSPNSLYFGSDKLYRSTDNGVSVSIVSQNPIVSGQAITSIGIAPSSDNIRLVGLNNGQVWGTLTGSSTLLNTGFAAPAKLNSTSTTRPISRVVIDPNNANVAYLTLPYYAAAAGQQVWKTTNLNQLGGTGVTWTAMGNGIPQIPTSAFAIDSANSNILYAGTDIGVYQSTDGGANWAPFGTGLPRVAVFDMAISRAQSSFAQPPVLRIATHGRGMWEIAIAAPTSASGTIRGQITTADGAPLGGVSITLNGAKNAHAITDSLGRYSFSGLSVGEFYTVTPSRANYSFAPSSRSISLNNETTDAEFTAKADAAATANAIDSADFFVRQHYLDFLDREPDEGGLAYWTAQIEQCGVDAACVSNRRIDVSAAYFIEAEFQKTGSFVYGLYKGSLGRNPQFAEFMPDRSRITAGSGLEASKQALAEEWVTRSEFKSAYPDSMSAADFVNKLFDTAGLANNSADRQRYITAMQNGASRSQVLREVVDSDAFRTKEYNKAFVLTQYFGYLRRDPDQAGLDFWVDVLNREPNNFRGMVCSFITSAEYQKRFSSVVSHTNAECGQ